MKVMHYNIQLIEIPDEKIRQQIKNSAFAIYIIKEFDERHWLIETKQLTKLQNLCRKLGYKWSLAKHDN